MHRRRCSSLHASHMWLICIISHRAYGERVSGPGRHLCCCRTPAWWWCEISGWGTGREKSGRRCWATRCLSSSTASGRRRCRRLKKGREGGDQFKDARRSTKRRVEFLCCRGGASERVKEWDGTCAVTSTSSVCGAFCGFTKMKKKKKFQSDNYKLSVALSRTTRTVEPQYVLKSLWCVNV